MSMHDRATAAMLAQLAMAADGAVFGLGVAYVAYRSIRKYRVTSLALGKIRQAPAVEPSDLRSVINSSHEDGEASTSTADCGKLIVVRGAVEVKSVADRNWKGLRGANVVMSRASGEEGVIVQQTQTCIYNELKGIFGWPADIRSLFSRSWKERGSASTRMVPFILVGGGKWPQSDHLVVNMEGSKHPLPLTTIYSDLEPINASPLTFLQALFGLEYPVGLLYEEKILPLGKEITAVGICKLKNGIPEIKSCADLPYFLSDLNKDQIISELALKSKVLMWSGFAFGALAIGIIGYSIARRRQRLEEEDSPSSSPTPGHVALDEEPGDVPDGELCVVCLIRRRRSAFIPCGHLVCCQRCALEVERDVSPKCPVCRQPIRSSVRIYDS
ncbi:mitochondrial ubiquitin ligase activator of nfkb 1 [Phtheirospermum japonicum]|uniref:RING-type E3 ubiquitin transferase n=1 Tax=Phtheirospermum japonicum TaxID=374723 RepID=A0A830C039_9LAMI|nr:mitochondrial ubiquitin ligase activator of nfkb 1 [Phtheirospermum japonicum]